ncbi:ABC transporter permease [Cytobacillus purgationiresistens]|uniref:ABC-2 type transport system permease protein n=1 Tax=Cytobacillus purgationiresistens TaxID=863449 RepID=A0ABU0AR80_9BACI|nr:ABC transporter permease [Cytobacillus purgationiresistens]MDQ0272913.1 ABC-2 type transport system permease protein [Cytobacillus purgationiresistens]
MTFSMKRLLAIFNKDYKDLTRNLYVSFTLLVPLVLAAVFGRQGIDSIDLYYMVFNMALCLVAAYIQCSLIAEEKEKNTLRGLMLSPASTMEILVGKGLLSFVTTILVIGISAYFLGYMPENLLIVSLGIILSTVFYIALGTALGLVTRSVMEASVIIMPFVFIFSFGTSLSVLAEKYPILQAADYLPNSQLIMIAKEVEMGTGLAELWSHFGIIGLWVIGMALITMVIYRKRMVD